MVGEPCRAFHTGCFAAEKQLELQPRHQQEEHRMGREHHSQEPLAGHRKGLVAGHRLEELRIRRDRWMEGRQVERRVLRLVGHRILRRDRSRVQLVERRKHSESEELEGQGLHTDWLQE